MLAEAEEPSWAEKGRGCASPKVNAETSIERCGALRHALSERSGGLRAHVGGLTGAALGLCGPRAP